MTVEYRIKCEKGEWIITQRVDSSASGGVPAKNDLPRPANTLGASFDPGGAEGGRSGGEDDAHPGGAGGIKGIKAIVIFGPVVISNLGAPDEGGGGEDQAGPFG